MGTIQPTRKDIEKLVAFKPLLYAEGFRPVVKWHGGERPDGTIQPPYPEYEYLVRQFEEAATADCWRDRDYLRSDPRGMLKDHALVATASIEQLRTLLTFCTRGEHFCEGFLGRMIEAGHVRRILERLDRILEKMY